MANKVVLVSDDSDFFEFIKLKLELRGSDELFTFTFDEVTDKLGFIETTVLIVNSENSQQQTLDLLQLFSGAPVIVIAYNDDESFRKKCYRAGMFDFITLLTPDSEFRARMIPALNMASILEKNRQYRQMLVKNKIISPVNEVYVDYEKIIDNALENIKKSPRKAVFGAISPDEKGKFLLKPNQIETILISNLRKNDLLMNYAPSKYFLIMFDTDIKAVNKLWAKISLKFKHTVYAGFTEITNQNRQQLITQALNKMNENINANDKGIHDIEGLNSEVNQNFKLFRKEFSQKFEQIITPVFFSVQQKLTNKLTGVKIKTAYKNNCGIFNIKGKHFSSEFRISSPGFSKIITDIILKEGADVIDSKRITFEPEELDSGLLGDLLSQFAGEVTEYINKGD